MGLSEETRCDRCGREGSALREHGHGTPCARTQWPAGHVIHMSLSHSDQAQSVSVAECDCGWQCRVPWPSIHLAVMQDAAIEAHWQAVEVSRETKKVSRMPICSRL